MHEKQMEQDQFAAECIAICRRGFANEHAWAAWWKKRATRIRALPPALSGRVAVAWQNATAKEFSK